MYVCLVFCYAFFSENFIRILALDKSPGVHPVGIREALRWELDKRVMRVAGDQANTECGNLHLCTGLKAIIEGKTDAVKEKPRERTNKGRAVESEYEAGEDEKKRDIVFAVELYGTEEEAPTNLELELEIEMD